MFILKKGDNHVTDNTCATSFVFCVFFGVLVILWLYFSPVGTWSSYNSFMAIWAIYHPFIVLSDEGLGPNLQSGDIEILVKDMEIIIRGDAINTVIGILRHFDSSSLVMIDFKHLQSQNWNVVKYQLNAVIAVIRIRKFLH